jgi:glycosidase
MGFNAIWLMPINPGPTGHGYHIVDYYGIEEDYGTEEDFIELVETAHDWDIKIILDLVINHTAIEHPFMQDAIAFDTYSHYWDYYDRDASGNYTYYYDWITLPNLNYDNPEVWWEFINVSEYWVETYNIDGFRCDVAWGPQSRNPDFWIAWRDALKTIKPELFLLAEATSTDFTYFDYRFDSAMDWNLHHEADYSLQNMFPGPPNLDEVHQIIINYGYPYPQYHYPFRFLENHDEERFINIATPTETKLAATLIYTIPGIPQIYAGQEIGTTSQRGQIIWFNDPHEMAEHYFKLGQIRNMLPAVRTPGIERLDNTQYSTVYSYYRYQPGENPVIAVLNFAGWSQVVTVDVPIEALGIDPEATYYLNELLGGTYTQRLGADLASITTSIDAKKARVYAIADSILLVGVQSKEPPEDLPLTYRLAQSYPNPFNAECRIAFELPKTGKVKLEVYNLMGQRVKILADNVIPSGRHYVTWNGRNDYDGILSSGVYFYRMTAGDFTQIKKMILLK